MNPFTHFREKVSAVFAQDGSTTAHGYTSKIERWREHPLELTEHANHDRVTTNAHYGEIRVCYCYDCDRHYRQFKRGITRK